ncbi:MAG: hypothetical protein HY790_09380 [Deltaproteobacteria bacterium]|nr:hypothetical protein [Deltaproteobacteria bacterium]
MARYLAALEGDAEPGNQGLLAGFRLTRKAGQNLGAFVGEVASQGWDAALAAWGITEETGQSKDIAAPALAGALMETDGSLEGAVACSSLAAVLHGFGVSEQAEPTQVVTQFLAEALYQRLILDLGEPLEAASRSYGHWQKGLDGLRSWIVKTGAMEGREEPPPPEQWRGLAGWNWVTLSMEKMLQRLLE